MITAVAIVKHDGIHLRKDFDPNHKDCTLPIILEYLAEGAANVVLRLVPFGAASKLKVTPPGLQHKLLRIRKDKPFLASVAAQYTHLTFTIAPLFPPENLVQHILVTIDVSLLTAINDELSTLRPDRPPRHVQDTITTAEPNALLVTDMSGLGTQIALEFKPKWLLPSPNAPAASKRCRTCALRAMRLAEGKFPPERAGSAFCPLALMGKDDKARLRAAEAILVANGCEWFLDGAGPFAAVLGREVAPVLKRLEELQRRLDTKGVMEVVEEPSVKLLLAMTLRDCAVFVRVQKSFLTDPVEVRLADLDTKMPHPDKVGKWRGTEERLIQGGWYENTEEVRVQEQVCVLACQELAD
ncbi:hypothetical protein K461DRAFT_102625 [Myriangium duriaei CBS 260.36]|uniref:Inositol-pentakisphosphate 2-kinase n=1 Tax=Myriangium duriaei CBS 260.36 TaxID=1168546 RepID=A0A9P4MHI9_9PEZI|nr:hypothetical protein K461DRAFT_102625 [Myriangium duriaei CBS 260.36]